MPDLLGSERADVDHRLDVTPDAVLIRLERLDWSATLRGKGGKVLAPATKRRAIVRVKSVMVHVREMRWLTYDPAADLDSPEQRAITATASEDIRMPEQMGKFLDHVAAHRLAGCFALTLLGLGREEVHGMRWSDLDLETGALHIRRARIVVNGRDIMVPTKTERGPWTAGAAARARDPRGDALGTPTRAPGGGGPTTHRR